MYHTVVQNNVIQDVPFKMGQDMDPINLPTELPIAWIDILLKGRLTAGNNDGAAQTSLWPIICNLLGTITIKGTPLDGSDGIGIKQVSAGFLWFRDWMMKKTQPEVVDIDPTNVAGQDVRLHLPIRFLDPRLPISDQIFTALEAMRYSGGQNSSLQLQIKSGNLNAANGSAIDRVAIVGDTGAPGVGTLKLSVSVGQIVPSGWVWPNWNSREALGMLDLYLEYDGQIASTPTNSNGIPVQARGIQAETFFFDVDRDVNQVETPVNNLGVGRRPELAQRLGITANQRPDPDSLRATNRADYLPAATSWPTGVYAFRNWHESIASAKHLLRTSAALMYDLNMGNSSLVDSLVRMGNVTYNLSRKAREVMLK